MSEREGRSDIYLRSNDTVNVFIDSFVDLLTQSFIYATNCIFLVGSNSNTMFWCLDWGLSNRDGINGGV